MKILSLIKQTLVKDHTLSSYWKKIFAYHHKEVQRSNIDTIVENNLLPTTKRFKLGDECQMRELAGLIVVSNFFK